MATLTKFLLTALVVILAAAGNLNVSTAQTTHVVGNGLGWIVPPGGSTSYVTWAASRTFVVGDSLIFNFTTQSHDVAEVNSGAFDGCNGANPISMITNGPANITITSAGPHFYICTFARHCNLGQKLAINVSSAAPPSVALPSPSPAPISLPPTTTPSPSPSISPSGSNAAAPVPSTSSISPSDSGSGVPPAGADAPSAVLSPPGISAPPPPPNDAATSFTNIAVLPVTLLSIVFAVFLYLD